MKKVIWFEINYGVEKDGLYEKLDAMIIATSLKKSVDTIYTLAKFNNIGSVLGLEVTPRDIETVIRLRQQN